MLKKAGNISEAASVANSAKSEWNNRAKQASKPSPRREARINCVSSYPEEGDTLWPHLAFTSLGACPIHQVEVQHRV